MNEFPHFKDVGYVHNKDEISEGIEAIVESLHKKEALFFFGAGMSAESGVSISEGLLKEALKKHFFEPLGLQSEPLVLEELIKFFPFEVIIGAIYGDHDDERRQKLRELLDRKFANASPSEAHWYFASILGATVRRIYHIYTTNFDDILEKYLEDKLISITEDNFYEKIKFAYEKFVTPVIHLHGIHPNYYIISEGDVFLKESTKLNIMLLDDLLYSESFVFVGYSMNDPDFRRLYMKYREQLKARREAHKKAFIVYPLKKEHNEYFYRLACKVWEYRGFTWIPLDAKTFFKQLKKQLEERHLRGYKEELKPQLDLKDEDTLDDLLENIARILRISKEEAIYFLREILSLRGRGHDSTKN